MATHTFAFRLLALTASMAIATATASVAEVNDDLRCYKVKDPLKLKAIVDFVSEQGTEAGCAMKGGAFVCVPGATTVLEAKVGKTPLTLLPVEGVAQSDYRVCYKLKCDGTPPPQDITDKLGARTLDRKNVGMLCTPALNGLFDPDCTSDANCDDGDPCNGFETCAADHQCETGTPIGCLPGDIVFVAPFQSAPAPATHDVSATPKLEQMDVYLVLDRSGSMLSEITTIKNNAAAAINGLRCPPAGSGSPGTCIPDLWAGAGTSGYAGAGGSPYTNHVDLQPSPSFAGVATTEPGGCCNETQLQATWSAVTGSGSAVSGCPVAFYADRSSCTGSPADNGGYDAFGYPCFRTTSLPVMMLATDEQPTVSLNCPNMSTTVIPAAAAAGVRIVGLLGSGASGGTQTELEILATGTGAVDASMNPLVFDAADANSTAAMTAAIQALRAAPIDTRAVLVDDPSDAVNAVSAFLERVETLQSGTLQCTSGQSDQDSNGDTFADEYVFLAQETPVCWSILAKTNASVPATSSAQVFPATLRIEGARKTPMAPSQRVLFVVPPQ